MSGSRGEAAMRVLISGGCGFIGSALGRELVRRHSEVVVLDSLTPQVHGEDPTTSFLYRSIADKAEVVRADVRSKEGWEQALPGVDCILHFAAETGTGQSMYETSHYASVNVGGTAALFDALADRRHSVRKIVVASSRAVYGEGAARCSAHGVVYPGVRRDRDMQRGEYEPKCPVCGLPTTIASTSEEAPKRPISVYGLTKQWQEEMVLLLGRTLGIPALALRYQNVYGPGQSLSNPYTGILSVFATRLRLDREVCVFEDGKESRDFVYIDDVVRATMLALETDSGDTVYNVGSGVGTRVFDVALSLKQCFGSASTVRVNQRYRLGDIRHSVADLKLIRASLGFEPVVPFAEGVKLFAQWALQQEPGVDRFDRSIAELQRRGMYR
jgi:dTDP-L-rhamnose 4-epimerase